METRRRLLDAALVEFAAVGFEAASTRTIATRAGVRQGQLTYHYSDKDELWRATVDRLFERFDEEFAVASASFAPADDDAAATFEAALRALVRVVSRLPELNRMMIHASTIDSERLDWLVERHVRARFEEQSELWQRVRVEGGTHLDADPLLIYYCVLGATSLLYVNAAEAARLSGAGDSAVAVTDAVVVAHADAVVAMVLGPRQPPKHSASRRKKR